MNPVTRLNAVLLAALATLLVSRLRPFLLPGSVLTLITRLRAGLVNLAAAVGTAGRLTAAVSSHAATHPASATTPCLHHRCG